MADTKVIESLLRETISALKNGGAGGSVKEVDTLPEITEENKTKIFKVKDEANLYAPALIKSTTTYTNRLPDEEQIDKAYLYEGPDDIHYYKGAFKLICTDGDLNGYGWCINGSENSVVLFTLDNAVNVTLESHLYGADVHEGWVINGNTATTTDYSVSDIESEIEDSDTLSEYGIGSVIPATYNAPESAQIGNAMLNDTGEGDTVYIYKGEKEIVLDDGSVICYYWQNSNENINHTYLTRIPASEILSDNGAYCIVPILKCNDEDIYIADDGKWTFNGADFDEYFESYSKLIMNIVDGGDDINIIQLNAPDSEQVGHATIIDYDWDDTNLIYDGTEVNIEYEGNTYHGYKWNYPNRTDIYWFTTKKASELYGQSGGDLYLNNGGDIFLRDGSELNTVKYQRAETTEEWDWENTTSSWATDKDIHDILYPTIYLLLRDTSSEGYPLMENECLQHTSGDTMQYDGQLCYRWVKYGDNGGTKQQDTSEIVVLTNTLDIQLPLTNDSPELVASLTFEHEAPYEGKRWLGMTFPYVQLIVKQEE